MYLTVIIDNLYDSEVISKGAKGIERDTKDLLRYAQVSQFQFVLRVTNIIMLQHSGGDQRGVG